MILAMSKSSLAGQYFLPKNKCHSFCLLILILLAPGHGLAQRMGIEGYIEKGDNTVVRGLIGVKSPVT